MQTSPLSTKRTGLYTKGTENMRKKHSQKTQPKKKTKKTPGTRNIPGTARKQRRKYRRWYKLQEWQHNYARAGSHPLVHVIQTGANIYFF